MRNSKNVGKESKIVSEIGQRFVSFSLENYKRRRVVGRTKTRDGFQSERELYYSYLPP